jgi:hypothetical protein
VSTFLLLSFWFVFLFFSNRFFSFLILGGILYIVKRQINEVTKDIYAHGERVKSSNYLANFKILCENKKKCIANNPDGFFFAFFFLLL